jgi:hypothetical protein
MQETYIHLPQTDNDGRVLFDQQKHVLGMLLSTFGGYTSHSASGAWRDEATGKVYHDPVARVAIAADWNDARNTSALLGIARFAAKYLRQECIYVAFPSGVLFVSAEAMAVAAE